MKRGNTALKRGVGLASAFALAIAGAVIAAPAANAATATADALRATPAADAAYVTATGAAGDYTGATAYAAATAPAGQAYVLRAGVNGQKANSLQVAIPAGYTGGNVDISLSTGVSWASYSVSMGRVPFTAASLEGVVGVADSANHASAGIPADTALLQADAVTGTSTPSSGTLRVALAGDASGNTTGFYILSINNVAVNVASTVASGAVVADLTGSTVADTAGPTAIAGKTTLGYVTAASVTAAAGAVEADASGNLTLPDLTVSELAAGTFTTAGGVGLTISATGTAPTADVSGAKATASGAGLAVGAVSKTGLVVSVPVTSASTDAGSVKVSGIKLTGVDSGATITVTVTTPATAGTADNNTTAAFSHVPNLAGASTSIDTTRPDRIAGSDRYDTAADVLDAGLLAGTWAVGTTKAVVIANGETAKQGVDALAANYLAAAKSAPILLTSAGTLPNATRDALIKLFKGYNSSDITVYVMGKTDSVSQAVRDQISFIIDATAALTSSQSVKVVEVAGDNRYQTSAAAATEAGSGALKLHSLTTGGAWQRTAFLASGTVNADALSVGPVAVAEGIPVLLTNGAALDTKVKDAITSLGITQVVVLGGTDRVSADLVSSLADLGVTSTKRIAKSNRYDTAAAIASWAYAALNPSTGTDRGLGWTGTGVYIANGTDGFPDALSVGPLAGDQGFALLTTATDALTSDATDFLKAQKATLTDVWALGQQDRVSAAVITAAQDAIK